MKKIKKLLMIFIITFSIGIPSIGVGLLSYPLNVEAASVKISATKKTIYVGNKYTLKINGTKSKVSWSSSNKSVATVSSKGQVKAKKKGTAIIKAKVNDKYYSCKITVKNKVNSSNSSSILSDKPVLVYEDTNAKIYFVKVNKTDRSSSNTDVVFRVENKTERTLTIQANTISINGESTNSIIMSDKVAALSNGNVIARCKFDLTYLDLNKIETIGGELRIIDFNDSNFKTYSARFTNIELGKETNNSKEKEVKETSKGSLSTKEVVVYEDNNIKIRYLKVDERDGVSSNTDVVFRVENKTERTLTIQANTISINGESTNSIIMSDRVAPLSNGNVIARCKFDLAYLDLNKIETIGGELRIIDFNDNNFKTYSAKFTKINTDGSSNVQRTTPTPTPTPTLTLTPIPTPAITPTSTPTSTQTSDASMETTSDIKNFLNDNYSTLNTCIGTTKFTFKIVENTLSFIEYDYWVQVGYEYSFFEGVKSSIKYTEEQKSQLRQELRAHQEKIAQALISRMPEKKWYGGYYDSWYKYPTLKIDLQTRRYYSWTNYEKPSYNIDIYQIYNSVKPSSFRWWSLIDDEL